MVLIHGAGLGNFIWNDLRPKLNYPSLAVNFPNRGRAKKTNQFLVFDDYCDRVINQVKKWNMNRLIIVGHSIGGCVAMRVADHFKSHVIGFVGISAAIPQNGDSFISCLSLPQRIFMPLLLRLAGTQPPNRVIEDSLCNDLDSEETKIILEKYTTESRWLFTDPCKVEIPATTKLYIKLTNDESNAISMQERMAKNLNAHHVQELYSGHLPMISQPKQLAGILNSFCGEVSRAHFFDTSSAA